MSLYQYVDVANIRSMVAETVNASDRIAKSKREKFVDVISIVLQDKVVHGAHLTDNFVRQITKQALERADSSQDDDEDDTDDIRKCNAECTGTTVCLGRGSQVCRNRHHVGRLQSINKGGKQEMLETCQEAIRNLITNRRGANPIQKLDVRGARITDINFADAVRPPDIATVEKSQKFDAEFQAAIRNPRRGSIR